MCHDLGPKLVPVVAQLPRLVGPYFPTQGFSGVLIRGVSDLSGKKNYTIQCDVASWYQINTVFFMKCASFIFLVLLAA